MPLFKIQHITKYNFDRLIQENVNEIRIFPVESDDQQIIEQNLVISGNPEMLFFFDYWGNKTGTFNLLAPHRELIVKNNLLVRTRESAELRINFVSKFDGLHEDVSGNIKMLEFLKADTIHSQSKILDIIRLVRSLDDSVAIMIQKCSDYIFEHFLYIRGITDIETTVDEILQQSAGVCQDFAHLLLQILRTMHIPGRYVSGYICPHRSGLKGEGATHAWVEAWIPGSGWTGIDPTNKIWVTNNHVKLAVGRNFADCTPVKGSFKGIANQDLSVFVSVDYEDGLVSEDHNEAQTMKLKTQGNSPHFSPAAQQ
jgi:transglutaminase-like putative cysteine protease